MDEFLHSPIEVSGAIVTIALGASAALRTGRRFWSNMWARLRSKPIVPLETIRVVQNLNGSYWAGGAKLGDKPVLQIVFYGHVTERFSKTASMICSTGWER